MWVSTASRVKINNQWVEERAQAMLRVALTRKLTILWLGNRFISIQFWCKRRTRRYYFVAQRRRFLFADIPLSISATFMVFSATKRFIIIESILQTIMEDPFTKTYQHWQDNRSQNQIFLTNELARSLTQLNINRIKQRKKDIIDDHQIKTYYKDYLFVCIHGIPKVQQQFQFLNLPGTILEYCFQAFETNISEQQRKQFALNCNLQSQAAILHQKIQNISLTKPLIFVYHSFGANIMSVYCKKYSPLNRLKGLIDIGGIPITFYPIIRQFVQVSTTTPLNQLEKDPQFISQRINQALGNLGMKKYQSKYMAQALLLLTRLQAMKHLFQYHRQYPNVLKCFIFGRKDQLLTQNALNEKAVYYCYKKTIDQCQQLKRNYKKVFGIDTKNVQQRFIFNLQGAHHSLHYSDKRKDLIKDIVWGYLAVLCNNLIEK